MLEQNCLSCYCYYYSKIFTISSHTPQHFCHVFLLGTETAGGVTRMVQHITGALKGPTKALCRSWNEVSLNLCGPESLACNLHDMKYIH